LFVCISTTDAKFKSNHNKKDFESFEADYLNMMENYASTTDGQIVISSDEGLYERNGCYMIDGNSFSRMTGANVTHFGDETDIRYENCSINIKNNLVSNQNGDIECLPQDMEYFKDGCAFPIQTVAEALGYKVNIRNSEEEQSVTLTREFSTKRLIVKYKGSIDSCGAVASAEGYNDLHIFQYADEQSTAKAFKYYNDLSFIEYVESDEVVTVEETKTESSSASYSSTYRSWGAEAMGVGNYVNHINSTVSTLPEVIVAVIDTGIDTDHEWFTNRIATGGKNFSTSKTENKTYEYEDDQGHGTHVSGIITDLTLSNVKILPIKVMNESGIGYTSSIVLGIQYVTSLKQIGRNIRALNMSLGGTATTESNQLYSDSLSAASNNGILPVVSAGNENTDTAYISPANVSCAITVAALANANGIYYRPYYSNYGSYVDVAAPGSAILSARMGGGTVTMSGTSMAAPHVAAAAALVFTEHSEYTHSQVETLFRKTAIDLGDKGKDKYYGYGMVNLRYIYAELLSDVTFSQTEIDCTQPFDLMISHTNSDVEIYYTTDGTFPTPENGTLYTSPIRISRSMKIRAAAYVFDGSDVISYSNPKEIVYRFGNQDLENCFIVDYNSEGLAYYQGILEDLTIPQVIDGVTIRTICSGAFTSTKVVNVILPNTTTEIQSNAFCDCKNLETVLAPNVKNIGNYAFQSCPKFMYLTDEYFPEVTKIGAYAFYQCENLRDISLSKVEIVDAYAFYMRNKDPKYLTSINLPSAKIISEYAFNYASYVTSVNLPKVEILSDGAFQMNDIRNLSLPKAVYLGTSAFYGNDKMAYADLPEAVYLSTYALAGTTDNGSILSSVNLPKAKVLGTYVISHTLVTEIDLPSVETLLPLAFYTQRLLESITAPNLKYVCSQALGYCEALTEIELPSVITLDNAFYGCKNLQKITLSPCLEKMTFYTRNDRGDFTSFRYVPETCVIYYYKGTIFDDFYRTTGIKNPIVNLSNDEAFTYVIVNGEVHITGLNGAASDALVIPSYIDDLPVTKICADAFEGCLSSIKLNVLYLREIEANAFKGCSNLTEVYLTRINTIGAYAFANCSNLEKVTIESIAEIGAYAFNGCSKLKTITLSNSLDTIGEKALGFIAEELISDFIIYGDEDTIAYVYAEENGIEFKTIFENIKGFYYDTYLNERTGNEEIVIKLVDTQTTGHIIIPETYNGKIISKIGDEAFSDCLVNGVILPETITDIGQKAFYDCHFMESINLEHVLTVGSHAFSSCQSLQYVSIPLVTEFPWGVFSNCSKLKVADLSGAIEIGQDVFYECHELEKVICPNLVTLDAAFKETTSLKSVDTKNVVTIIGNAFMYSKSIEELYFPNLETISSGGVFQACPSLKKVFIGENFKSYAVDIILDLASWSYYDVPIYGYSGSKAEEWALQCLNEDKTQHWTFTSIDDMDELSITKNLPSRVETEYDSNLNLSVEAEGIGLTYQWYTTEGDTSLGIPIKDATESQLKIDTVSPEASKYFVQVTDWKNQMLCSQICEVVISQSDSVNITVTTGEHVQSSQSGNNQVNLGENFKVIFTSETGYHISSVVIDDVALSDEDLQIALINGYDFTNISQSHTIVINSAPN
ncbi:MAG: leucine-rich repeat protein, partial [Anaeroplasmataceae bacterium]|nr:leucine-rich repeat protein [Anaeroplasmataceae bacterium]